MNMVNETLPLGIIVEVDSPKHSFFGKIVEVSDTHIMDDVWYKIDPIPGENTDTEGYMWFHQRHVYEIELI